MLKARLALCLMTVPFLSACANYNPTLTKAEDMEVQAMPPDAAKALLVKWFGKDWVGNPTLNPAGDFCLRKEPFPLTSGEEINLAIAPLSSFSRPAAILFGAMSETAQIDVGNIGRNDNLPFIKLSKRESLTCFGAKLVPLRQGITDEEKKEVYMAFKGLGYKLSKSAGYGL